MFGSSTCTEVMQRIPLRYTTTTVACFNDNLWQLINSAMIFWVTLKNSKTCLQIFSELHSKNGFLRCFGGRFCRWPQKIIDPVAGDCALHGPARGDRLVVCYPLVLPNMWKKLHVFDSMMIVLKKTRKLYSCFPVYHVWLPDVSRFFVPWLGFKQVWALASLPLEWLWVWRGTLQSPGDVEVWHVWMVKRWI